MSCVHWITKATLFGIGFALISITELPGPAQVQTRELTLVHTMSFFAASASAQEREPVVRRWPDPRTPEFTLQRAIDAMGDGDILRIAAGVHRISEPLFVYANHVTIEGAGCSPCPDPDRRRRRGAADLITRSPNEVTYLIGPSVDRVPRAEDAVGMFNFYGASGMIGRMNGSGFEAFLVTRDVPGSRSGPVIATELNIHGTGRGILGGATSDLWVTNSYIHDVTHNGASFFKSAAVFSPTAAITNSYIQNVGSVCYYGKGVAMFATNATFENCGSGLIANAPGGAIAGV